MPEEMKVGCARPVGEPDTAEKKTVLTVREDQKNFIKEAPMIKVGQKAPDFTAPAYHNGKFVSLKLSDYVGKWVVLCFYPGDFTFV